jgi:hypothetical protein
VACGFSPQHTQARAQRTHTCAHTHTHTYGRVKFPQRLNVNLDDQVSVGGLVVCAQPFAPTGYLRVGGSREDG